MKEKCLRPFLFAALVLAVCFAGSVAQAATVIVGTCQTGVQFATIQAAVNASPAGTKIDICPGSYPEQVTITKKLSLLGIASGTSDAAVVVAPANGVVVNATDIFGNAVAAQIFVENASSVSISHLTVDGIANGLSGCQTQFEGVYFQNSSGTITDNGALIFQAASGQLTATGSLLSPTDAILLNGVTVTNSGATIEVGVPGPGGDIAVGEGAVWVSANGKPLSKIDPATNRVVTQYVGKGGDALRVGLGSLWLSNHEFHEVWRIDPKGL